MKKIFLITCFTLSTSFLFSSTAQGLKKTDDVPRTTVHATDTDDNSDVHVSTRAVRNFYKQFKGATDIRWFMSEKNLLVYFMLDNIPTRAYFTSSGELTSYIHTYREKNLPADVRHQVKSTYYDFNITLVHEVHASSKVAYIITIEHSTAIKTIKVLDDEMYILAEYVKK